MESTIYNLSEALICFVPVFLIIALIFGALLWNSLPDRNKKREDDTTEE